MPNTLRSKRFVKVHKNISIELDVKGGTGAVNFDVKVKLEEKERRS